MRTVIINFTRELKSAMYREMSNRLYIERVVHDAYVNLTGELPSISFIRKESDSITILGIESSYVTKYLALPSNVGARKSVDEILAELSKQKEVTDTSV